MIIECPSCQSRYRIRGEKLPKGGGNIKCPNCAHVFFVSPDGPPAAPRGDSAGADASVSRPAAKAPPVPTTKASPAPATEAPPAPAAPPAPPAQEPTAAPPTAAAFAAAARPAEPAPPTPAPPVADAWKLRNAVGLVYDFTDLDQLRRWLSARESHDGLQASRDGGGTWQDLTTVPELSTVKATGRKTVMGMAALTAASGGRSLSEALAAAEASERESVSSSVPSADNMRERAQARLEQARRARTGPTSNPSKPRKFDAVRTSAPETRGSKLIGMLALVVLPLFAIAALQMAGVVDLRSVLEPTPPEPEYEPPLPTTNPLNDGPVVRDQPAQTAPNPSDQLTPEERELRRTLADAAAAYERGELPVAIGSLERAAYLDPENLELHCQIAELYAELGQPREAEAARGRCNPNAPSEGSGQTP